jgi:hypothetical protein
MLSLDCQDYFNLMLFGNEFGHFISLNVGQLPTTSIFTDLFTSQLDTLQNIEDVDRTAIDDALEAQVFFFFL